MDTVILRNLHFDLGVGLDAWRRPDKAQPVNINIELSPEDDFEAAALQDDVSLTTDYGKLYKSMVQRLLGQNFTSLYELWMTICQCTKKTRMLIVDISLPKAVLLAAEGLTYSTRVTKDLVTGQLVVLRVLTLRQIACSCIVGVNPHERIDKQRLAVTIGVAQAQEVASLSDAHDGLLEPSYHDMVNHVVEVCFIEKLLFWFTDFLQHMLISILTACRGFFLLDN